MLQGKQCCLKRVQNAEATVGVPLREWTVGTAGRGAWLGGGKKQEKTDKVQRRGWGWPHRAPSSRGDMLCPRQRCVLGFSSYNSLIQRRIKKHPFKKHLKILTDWFLMGGRAIKIPMITECI